MTDTEYLNSMLQQESLKGGGPSMIPIPNNNSTQQNNERPPVLSRDPTPEEKIQMMGAILGATMQQASKADSDYVDLGNPQGFREREAARQNLYKIAENLDQQRNAIKRGQQVNLNPVNIPVIKEPVIPNFISPNNQTVPQTYNISNNVQQTINQPQAQEQISQLEFNFNEPTNSDIIDAIAKLNDKVNSIIIQLQTINNMLNTNKKKLK